jgi:diguanylate cyclase (GGDEF)-like protein
MNGASSGQTVRIMFENSPIGMCAVMTDGTVLRANDAFRALLGGDEYAVLVVSDAPGKDALGVMVSRRINVAATVAAGGAPVTASIGIVGLCAGASVESLLEDADRAMYAAKRSGKARCVEAHATVRRVS